MKSSTKLPLYLKKYFWDCRFENLSWKKYSWFISERILNFGNMDSLSWLLKHLPLTELEEIVENSRQLNSKTKNFWEIMLKEPK